MNKKFLLLIDRDGVILPDSPKLYINEIYNYINKLMPISIDTIAQYLKTIYFNPYNAVYLFFQSIGLQNNFEDFKNYIIKFNEKNLFKLAINFEEFILFLNTNKIDFKIFTAANEENILKNINFLSNNDFLNITNVSKGNIEIFNKIVNENKVYDNIFIIDDIPFVLRTAKLAGISTILMKNELYNEKDINLYNSFIDYSVSSFNDIIKIIKEIIL